MKKKILFLLVGLLLLGFIGFSAYYEKDTRKILGYGTLEAREIYVGSKIGGRIDAVHVREGDFVEKDAKLITLDSRELQAVQAEAKAILESAKANFAELKAGYRSELIDKAQAAVEEQKESLKKLRFGPRTEEIEAQKAKMKTAAAEYNHAERTYKRLVEKLKQGILAEQEKDDVLRSLEMSKEKLQAETKNYELLEKGSREEDIAMAIARLAQAEAEHKRLVRGPRQEELDRAQALIQECEARLDRIRIQLEEQYIRAPIRSRVEVCDLEPGDILAAGQVAIHLLKPNDLWAKIYVQSQDLHRVKIGQETLVSIELSQTKEFRSWFLKKLFSFFAPPTSTKKFLGTIIHIASEAEFTPRNVQTIEERGSQVFAVKVRIEDFENFLRPGMSVTVEEKDKE